MIRTTADFETAKANGEVWPVGDAAGKHWTDGFAVYNEAGENVGYITAQEPGITDMTLPVATAATASTQLIPTMVKIALGIGRQTLKAIPWLVGGYAIDQGTEGLRLMSKEGNVIGTTANGLAEAVGKAVIVTGVAAIAVLWAWKRYAR